MALTSAISLLILVLATGCFTLPMDPKNPPTTKPLTPTSNKFASPLLAAGKKPVDTKLPSQTELPRPPRGDVPEDDHLEIELEERLAEKFPATWMSKPFNTTVPLPSENKTDSVFTDALSTTGWDKLTPREKEDDEESMFTERDYDFDDEETTKDERGYDSDEEEIAKDERGYDSDEVETTKDERGYDSDEVESTKDERGYDSDEVEATKDERGYDSDEVEATKDERGYDSDEEETTKGERTLPTEEETESKITREKRASDDEEGEEYGLEERDYDDFDEETTEEERDYDDFDEEATKEERDYDDDDDEIEKDERATTEGLEMPTSPSTSFNLTSSTVAPHLYTPEKSTELPKKTPLPTKQWKVQPPKKSKVTRPLPTTNTVPATPEHAPEEMKAPMAQLDQTPSDKVPNVKSNSMVLEKNTEMASKLPEAPTKVQPAPLAQGKQPI